MSEIEARINPPWGDLPSERYILAHWDESSPKSNKQQCVDLIRQFIQERFPSSPPSNLSPSRIKDILSPWRPLSLRELTRPDVASYNGIWLRTYYASAIDEEMSDAKDEFYYLNSDLWYDFGDDWDRVFEYFPELLMLGYHTSEDVPGEMRSLCNEGIKEGVEDARTLLESLKAVLQGQEEEDNAEEKVRVCLGNARFLTEGEDESTFKACVVKRWFDALHRAFVVSYIIIEDKEAMESGKVLLVFLDEKGRAVRQKRCDQMDIEGFLYLWDEGAQFDGENWEDGTLGDDYAKGGIRDFFSNGIPDDLVPLW